MRNMIVLVACLYSTGAFAFHGLGPVIPSEALRNCDELGGENKAVTLDRDTRAMCVVRKDVLREKMVKLRLISARDTEDEACDYWQEKGFPNPGRVNCEISFWSLDRRL